MRMKALYAALSGVILLGAATLAPAADKTMPASEYKAEKERIDADYKAANGKCKDMKGNEKDICHKQAQLDEKSRKADLEAKYKGTDKAAYDAEVTKAKAKLDLAQEQCEQQKGAEKSACKKQAKADEQKAIADAKAAHGKKVASAPMSAAPASPPPANTAPPPASNPPATK